MYMSFYCFHFFFSFPPANIQSIELQACLVAGGGGLNLVSLDQFLDVGNLAAK